MQKYLTFLAVLVLALFGFGISSAYSKSASSPVAVNDNGEITHLYLDSNPLLSSKKVITANDRYIEDNYPLSIWHSGGQYLGGRFIDVTVANFEGDLFSELLVSSLAAGPLNGFNYDGSVRAGFPVSAGGVAYTASIDNYMVVAFHGVCDPGCHSLVNLYDGTGALLWSKNTTGIGVSAAPVMYKENGEIYIIYENSALAHLSDIYGNDLPGWPLAIAPHAFATADFDGDGVNEIVIAPQAGNSQTRLIIFRKDGGQYSATPNFGVQTRVYPTIGDVDGDGELEIVVIGRMTTAPYRSEVKIFNHDGTLQASYTVEDNTDYGTQNALADMNADGVPEILFVANNNAYVMDADGNDLPGWPKLHSPTPSYPLGTNIVVGDVISDGDREYPEVIYTLRSGYSQNGAIKIYNHDGTEVKRWDSQALYPIASGRSNAIADIDADGFNEIIIAGDYWQGVSGYYPTIWAIDLNKNERPVDHGYIHWGGYGNDSGKSGLYRPPSVQNLK